MHHPLPEDGKRLVLLAPILAYISWLNFVVIFVEERLVKKKKKERKKEKEEGKKEIRVSDEPNEQLLFSLIPMVRRT